MDPISMITAALVAGVVAAAETTAATAIKDVYQGLKTLIVRKYGEQAKVKDAIEGVENRPDSEPRQGVLKEELEHAGVAEDAEVRQAAQELLDLLQEAGKLPSGGQVATIYGNNNVVAQGGSTAATGGGVATVGDVHGGIHIGGSREKGDE